jgi:stage II sporulation protein D
MNRISGALRAAAFVLPALVPASGPCAADPASEAVRALAAKANAAGDVVRVGLDAGHRLLLRSEAPYSIVDPAHPGPLWRSTYSGETALIAEGGPEGEPASVFRVQVAAFTTQEAAEAERGKLEREFGVPSVVRFVPDRGSWRVRLGAAKDRGGLLPLLAKLRDAGRTGLWIAEEPETATQGVVVRIVDASWATMLTSSARVVALPAPGAFLQVEGKPYRGAIEIRVDASGRLRAIDWVEMESYLRGVVPSELGPEVWPQIEALKAQAVAARTYTLANLGQFDDDGYDICATPRCQAYGGVTAEHPLSDAAIQATAGEVATWQGKPIDALYTATCGGHTEDAKEIFPEQAAPYLKGVPCRAEAEVLARERVVVNGAAPVAVLGPNGEDLTREAWLLAVAGVFGEAVTRHLPRELARPVSAVTLRSWTTALARRSGLPVPAGPATEPSSLGAAALAIARDLGWDERARVLLSDADLPAVVRDPKFAGLPVAERRALAYLASQGALRPAPDGRWPLERAPDGAMIAAALARIAEAYDAFDLDEATVAGMDGGGLRLLQGRSSLALPLAHEPRLFTTAGNRAYPVAALALWPGDKVRYHRDAGARIDFLELRPPVKGLSDDRAAAVYVWEVRKTGRELQETVDRRVSVGTLRDLRVVRRGVSGRIVELEVTGSTGSTVVKGFDVRNLLDLRESLTVIELQRDDQGRIVSAVFAGKGWGHGVGLCQVGAYGMALRGADYKTILSHYYPGIVLAPARTLGAAGAGPR